MPSLLRECYKLATQNQTTTLHTQHLLKLIYKMKCCLKEFIFNIAVKIHRLCFERYAPSYLVCYFVCYPFCLIGSSERLST